MVYSAYTALSSATGLLIQDHVQLPLVALATQWGLLADVEGLSVIVQGAEQRPQLSREVTSYPPIVVRLRGPLQHPVNLGVLPRLNPRHLLARGGLATSHLHQHV
jgi:hypothetical protein